MPRMTNPVPTIRMKVRVIGIRESYCDNLRVIINSVTWTITSHLN